MRPTTTVLLLGAVLSLTGACGDGRQRESPPQAARFGDCTMSTFDSTGRPVATLRSDGGPVRVRLVPVGARHCPGSLVARSGSGVTGSHVSGLDLDASSARVATTRGPESQDLLVLASHPGPDGEQPHLFTAQAQEVRVDGDPLLPSLAPGHRVPLDATCAADGDIAVTTARPHQPPGVVLAWDLTRTWYLVDGPRARPTRSAPVAEAVADPTLRRRHPELYDDRLLTNCR